MSMNELESGFVKAFNLKSEIAEFTARKPWPKGLTSKTLLKTNDLRIMLIAMEPGAKMQEHHSDGRISVHCLHGSLRMQFKSGSKDARAGDVIAFDRSVKHDVEALEESAFLLTIAWPTSEELESLPHRGY